MKIRKYHKKLKNRNNDPVEDLAKLKLIFTILCFLLVILIWFSKDNFIRSGINKKVTKNDLKYINAYIWMISTLCCFSFTLIIDLYLQLKKTGYIFYRLNAVNLSFKVFELFLLAFFYFGTWHYFGLFIIFLTTQTVCFFCELYIILYSLCHDFPKYQRLKYK